MTKEFAYISTQNTVWTCVTCGCYITSEPTEYDVDGNRVILYTQASRYWKAGSQPGATTGVYCQAKCATTTTLKVQNDAT